ncbi:NADH peroxidase [bioreactor metagenome]|uniref:NADH peroxidase n=1 Tax=bioreactor metagenome TaxID=1076179 RepID=A0A644TFH6_9ZZZZ|nr:FAD-dependent oxidoreductase [Negativicutes bacterium]
MKVVIIGGVAAGLKSAAKIRRSKPQAQITVIEKGKLISYGACGIPYYVGGDIDDVTQLMTTASGTVRNADYFKNIKDIDVLTETMATNIDRVTKTVTIKDLKTDNESQLLYDKLVIATGATPIKPPLPGIDLANIYQMWHPDDAKAVRRGLETGKFKNAVIIGAGLVGMEMAEALTNWGIKVTVVEMKDQVLSFLDAEMAASVAQYATGQGVNILTEEKVIQFNGDGVVSEVVTDKRSVLADLVILSIGVKPNVELARQAGLDIGVTGAISVNEYLETSDPDIYAGGDCVENTNLVSGKKVFAPMGSTANKHGRVIGENICGGRVKFRGVLNTAVVKFIDFNIGKVGLTEREAKLLGYEYIAATISGHDRPHYMPEVKSLSLKLVVDAKNRRVLGAQAFGEGDITKRIDVIATALTLGGTIDDLFDIDLSYAPPYNGPIDNVAVAANVVMNKIVGQMVGISSFEAKKRMDEGNAIFLDVRAPEELKKIRLAHSDLKNIPLGQLRERVDEIDKDSEVVAVCKIGLRGYEASVILKGQGFNDVKVLEGGITAWPFQRDAD